MTLKKAETSNLMQQFPHNQTNITQSVHAKYLLHNFTKTIWVTRLFPKYSITQGHDSRGLLLRQLWIVSYYVKFLSKNCEFLVGIPF